MARPCAENPPQHIKFPVILTSQFLCIHLQKCLVTQHKTDAYPGLAADLTCTGFPEQPFYVVQVIPDGIFRGIQQPGQFSAREGGV